MKLDRYELLQIYSGLEKVWKERLRQSTMYEKGSEKSIYFKEEAERVNKIRHKISKEID